MHLRDRVLRARQHRRHGGPAGERAAVHGRLDGWHGHADLRAGGLGVPVERPEIMETPAVGAAFLAGLATGAWSSPAELAATWRLGRRFEPRARDDDGHDRWRRAVERAKGWARG